MITVYDAKIAVRDAVAAALAAAGEPDVQVAWGTAEPWERPVLVAVGDVVTERTRPRMGPARRADEAHEVTLIVGASRKDTDQEACTARACQVLNVIDTALRAQTSESVTAAAPAAGIQVGQIVGQITLTETDPDVDDASKGRIARLEATVTVTARRV